MASLQKYRSVLSLVQEACKQLGLAVPNGVYDVTDEHAVLMGSVINVAGVLTNEANSWQQMQDTFSCVGDGTTTEFPLPSDFARFTDSTGWSDSLRRPVVVLNSQQWAGISSWLSQSFYINPACRIWQDNLQFMSAPPAGSTVSFFYQTMTWVQDADTPTLYKGYAEKNGDIPQFDWILMILAIKIKWREAKGLDTAAAQTDFADRIRQLTQSNTLAPILSLSGTGPGGYRYLDNYYNSPDTNFGV
jgi:hypothetical protein